MTTPLSSHSAPPQNMLAQRISTLLCGVPTISDTDISATQASTTQTQTQTSTRTQRQRQMQQDIHHADGNSNRSSDAAPASEPWSEIIREYPQLYGSYEAPLTNDGISTATSREQWDVERRIDDCVRDWCEIGSSELEEMEQEQANLSSKSKSANDIMEILETTLVLDLHRDYIYRSLEILPQSYVSLDASRTWLVYWCIHSLKLMRFRIPESMGRRCIDFLNRCQDPEGGFAGGPGQMPHLATTYAAVNALATLSTLDIEPSPLSIIDRNALFRYLKKMKQRDGSFTVTDGGESDTRGLFCAISVASLTGLLNAELASGVAVFVASCQTYEGGIGGEPGNEAHGGYTFCALAATILCGGHQQLDLEAILAWTVKRQMRREGGFNGRTNKLVDGCYSFWVGAVIPLLQMAMNLPSSPQSGQKTVPDGDDATKLQIGDLVDWIALQRYILVASQDSRIGGFRDKPLKGPDLYHTCYCLSGLSIAQHSILRSLGGDANTCRPINPLYNLTTDAVEATFNYFADHDPRP